MRVIVHLVMAHQVILDDVKTEILPLRNMHHREHLDPMERKKDVISC